MTTTRKKQRGVRYWFDVVAGVASLLIMCSHMLFGDLTTGVAWLGVAIGFHNRWRLNDLEVTPR